MEFASLDSEPRRVVQTTGYDTISRSVGNELFLPMQKGTHVQLASHNVGSTETNTNKDEKLCCRWHTAHRSVLSCLSYSKPSRRLQRQVLREKACAGLRQDVEIRQESWTK